MKNERFIPAVYAGEKPKNPYVVFGIPIAKYQTPHPKLLESMEASVPLLEAAGFRHGLTYTAGNPYISGARAEITRKALDARADIIVYLDYDVSWDAEDMLKLLQAEGDVVGGTYRCKTDSIGDYMGAIYTHVADGVNELQCPCGATGHIKTFDGRPITRQSDGAIKARTLPAGFLKVTTACIDKFMRSYPELCYGPQYSLSVDLFNHGAHEGIWWGEDYAFCRNWEAAGGECWLLPNMNINHWGMDDQSKCWPGNYHKFLLQCPGGSEDPQRWANAHIEAHFQEAR